MHPQLKIYRNSIREIINTNFGIEVLASDCLFTEGPTWSEKGYYLFSDTPANVIYKIEPGKKKEVYVNASGCDHPADPLLKPDQIGSNGLAFNASGELLICQHGNHAVAKFTQGKPEPFINEYNGRPFNSPNDIIVHSNGKIFFSDPPYGLANAKLNPDHFQPLAGVYCWNNGEGTLVCDKYDYPNGVVLSPDEKVLYICSTKVHEAYISAYDTETYEFLYFFATETSDGIEIDPHGNIYLCNKDGIIILDPHGNRSASISLSSQPANCCWGGANRKDLFITARQNIFHIKNFLLPGE